MQQTASTVERAFDLARSGTCQSVEDVRKKLEAEGSPNVRGHLASGTLRKQLKAAIKSVRGRSLNHN